MTNRELLLKSSQQLGIRITDTQVDHFLVYMEELKYWNSRINLTSVTEDKEIITRHFIDSLTILKYLSDGSRILDIGTGAGFPGIPLAIVDDGLTIDMIDSRQKKIHFVNHIIRKLGLNNARGITANIEDDLNNINRDYYDLVVTRAFADITKTMNCSADYLAEGGRIVLMRGEKGLYEWEVAKEQFDETPKVTDIDQFTLPFSEIKRCVIVVEVNK